MLGDLARPGSNNAQTRNRISRVATKSHFHADIYPTLFATDFDPAANFGDEILRGFDNQRSQDENNRKSMGSRAISTVST